MEEVAVGKQANDTVTPFHPLLTRAAHQQTYQPEGYYNNYILCI